MISYYPEGAEETLEWHNTEAQSLLSEPCRYRADWTPLL